MTIPIKVYRIKAKKYLSTKYYLINIFFETIEGKLAKITREVYLVDEL